MTQYNILNVKLSNLQLNKLKWAIKNKTEVILRLSSTMIGNTDSETNFLQRLLLTNKQDQISVKLLQKIYQPTSSYLKLSYLNEYNQEEFLEDFLVHY